MGFCLFQLLGGAGTPFSASDDLRQLITRVARKAAKNAAIYRTTPCTHLL